MRLHAGVSLIAILCCSSVDAAKPKNAILLSEVQSITLSSSKSTTHRRVSAIPQLRCVSPKAICALHTIDTLRCVNQGSSYAAEDIQWACTAPDLPTTLRLGSTEVICEGYDSPGDAYVLKGSCGVEYRLVLTEEGERRFPGLAAGGGWGGGEDVDWSGYLFGAVFVGVLGWIVYSACVQGGGGGGGREQRRPQQGRRPGGGGGGGGWGPGGGGGGGGWDDPPPPYSKSSTSAGDQGWRPGFWSGVAGGAAAGYMAGNRGGNNNNTGGGFWGEGGASSSRRSGGGSSSSGSGSSTGRHESTGFGSTSRR